MYYGVQRDPVENDFWGKKQIKHFNSTESIQNGPLKKQNQLKFFRQIDLLRRKEQK